MLYRIIRYEEFDVSSGDIKAVFECQGRCQIFWMFPFGKWKTLRNNDKTKGCMRYKSLKKAKQEMVRYFLRDLSRDNSPFADRKRFCHYVDFDFMEYNLNSFV